jgi:hypothetical protein
MYSVGAGSEGLNKKTSKVRPWPYENLALFLNYESKLVDAMDKNISLGLKNANIANLQ